MRRAPRPRDRTLFFAALLLCASPLCAASPLDALTVRAGGFVTRFDTTIRYGDDASDDDVIDFDRELGLKDRQIIESLAVAWVAGGRHEFGVEHFNERLSGTRQLGREIEFDDEVFPLAATVYSEFTLEAFEFHYTWWALLREEWALGLRFGHVNYRMGTRIRLLLGEEGEPPDVGVEASWQDNVPAPAFGVDFRYVPAPRWRITANAGWFKARFKTVSPVITSAHAGVEYFIWENVGLWADYGMTHIDARVHSSRFDGSVEIYEGGLRLGVIWRM